MFRRSRNGTDPVNFDTAFDRLLGSEGGYSNDPSDPGGETNWGISKRSYPDVDIRNLTREQAKEIYRADFYNRIHADEMPGSVAFQAFDFAVNSGIDTAVRHLQRAINVADDGHWGPISKAAMLRADPSDTIMRLSAYRLDFMTRLNGWSRFGRGWARRISANLLYAADDT